MKATQIQCPWCGGTPASWLWRRSLRELKRLLRQHIPLCVGEHTCWRTAV